MNEETFDDPTRERERQRNESEARSIIHDVAKLYTYEEQKKTRWIWELLQNAKDVAAAGGVDVKVRLTPEQLTFSHNGLPFKTTNLLAILYKTSTKSLDGQGGTTGKYGTGFVTTHILSRKVTINGIHQNENGKRTFELVIDRSEADREEGVALHLMQQALDETFIRIKEINQRPSEEILSGWQSFTYSLTPESLPYAKKGVTELLRNADFTLLINPGIKSLSIEADEFRGHFIAQPHATSIERVSFLSTASDEGILYFHANNLTVAVPARRGGDTFTLLPINQQAILYKEFPLIGTEKFNLPVFIQHTDFHPTEQRDGILTKKSREDDENPTADKNRKALAEFIAAYLPFIESLIKGGVANTYLLARSGLPEYADKYSTIEWYQKTVQAPIRAFLLQQDIVRTANGAFRRIENTRFPAAELSGNNDFYSLISEILKDEVPDAESVWPWWEVINQDTSAWPANISINEEQLVRMVPGKLTPITDGGIEWLKRLYHYLENRNINHWGEKYPIYLSQADKFCIRDKVRIHPDIDDEFKIVAKGLNRLLDEEFLNKRLGTISAISPFDLKEFYSVLNKDLISGLDVDKATLDQAKAIFRVCSLFRSDRAAKREKWYGIVKELLPSMIGDRKLVAVDYENWSRSADNWTIRYLCYLIEQTQKPSVFTFKYFQSHSPSCFAWLREFLIFVFDQGEQGTDTFFRYKIIPTRADTFRPYNESVFAEEETKYFDKTIKNIYRDYAKKGDPRQWIIDRRVRFDGLRIRSVEVLTNDIDALFQDPNIETRVKKGGDYHEMFLQLNDWFETFSSVSAALLRRFDSRRASLYVLALGDGFSKQVLALQGLGRTMEEIAELAKTSFTNQEIKQLENAAGILGTKKLLDKAQEMLDRQAQVKRWQAIGTAAEIAFQEAIVISEFKAEIANPDIGKDFELIINAKTYSIEIKSVVEGKENVKMSILQGRTAVKHKDHYALCVLTRPANEADVVDKEYFVKNCQFVMDIGSQIGDRIANWDVGLQSLQLGTDIKVQLEDKTESVYINRRIWRNGISFDAFVRELQKIFSKDQADAIISGATSI